MSELKFQIAKFEPNSRIQVVNASDLASTWRGMNSNCDFGFETLDLFSSTPCFSFALTMGGSKEAPMRNANLVLDWPSDLNR